jgi:hypothetical protein
MPLIEETTKTKVDIDPEILTEIEEEAQVIEPIFLFVCRSFVFGVQTG